MKKYEYTVLDVPVTGWFYGGKIDGEKLLEKLNTLGKQGWEAVTMSNTNQYGGSSRSAIIILKREL